MKTLILSIIVLISIQELFSQDINKVITDPNINKEILYGYCDRERLTSEPFSSWFTPEYEAYDVDDPALVEIDSDLLYSCNIRIALGTWCPDSQREVPRFCKILDHLQFPENQLTLICVDRKKNAAGTEVSELDIELVPTIIILTGGEELGRIIESPEVTLEEDLLKILSK